MSLSCWIDLANQFIILDVYINFFDLYKMLCNIFHFFSLMKSSIEFINIMMRLIFRMLIHQILDFWFDKFFIITNNVWKWEKVWHYSYKNISQFDNLINKRKWSAIDKDNKLVFESLTAYLQNQFDELINKTDLMIMTWIQSSEKSLIK